jgi:glyoxylase-like metal-dependent hydrolase (beta-lactamase superfamily II)
MYELIQVSQSCYYVQSPTKVGIVKLSEDEVCLIDGGSDKETGRKIKKILDANGWRLKMILNTHSNADHIGGNRYLQEQTGSEIFANGVECDFTNHPILEPAFLFGGYPPAELRHKFLLTQESNAKPLNADILPNGMEILPLPGHFFDMVGFCVAEGIVYLADCLSSKETLDKYRITFIYDVGAYLETLERVKGMKAKLFIPAHAAPCEDIAELAQYNIDRVQAVAQDILRLCAAPRHFESLLQALFCEYGLQMSFEQYVLVGSTVRSYLAWLKGEGKITARFEENLLLWQSN